MPTPEPVIKAAGALLWRPDDDGVPTFALVHRPHRKDWTLPKGKLEPGEHAVATAVREVAEETGFHVALGLPLPTRRYLVEGRRKRVRYWAARADDTEPFQPGPEVDELLWLRHDDAVDRLSYPHDSALLRAFMRNPVDTVPLAILRHGKAVKRASWDGPDQARPLEPLGTAQARRLVPVLGAYGIRRIHSSNATRCVDTVRPYAEANALDIATDPLLSEAGHKKARKESRRRAAELLPEPEPLVVCSHRPVLPDILREVLPGGRGHEPDPLAPGAILVVHRRFDSGGPSVVAVERHRV